MDTTVEILKGTMLLAYFETGKLIRNFEPNSTYHIYFPIVLFNSGAQEEGKEQFVFLKQWSADIGIETEGEVIVDVQNSLLNVTGLCKTKKH